MNPVSDHLKEGLQILFVSSSGLVRMRLDEMVEIYKQLTSILSK